MSILEKDVNRQHKTNFHLIPGRLRVGIPALLNNQDLAFQIAHHLAKFPGVKMSYANPVTGQVLIHFDPYETDLKLLLSWISRTNGKNQETSSLVSLPPQK